jgi:Fibronectin type III domain
VKIRAGLVLGAVFASMLSFAPQQAQAFGGYASAPTSVSQTAIAGGIRVGWSAPVDVDTGITGYRVEHSTSGTSGTWTLASTTSSSTTTYDILGLSQVARYVRVAAVTTAGIGGYGYPWETIYSTSALRRDVNGNVTYDSDYGLSSLGGQASNTYASANYTRIKYRLDTTISSTTKYVESDFYTWPSGGATGSSADTTAPSLAGIAVPSVNAGQQWIVQANVSDLYVYSDNTSVTKTIGASGRLEIWPWNYSWGPSSLTPAGSSNSYDFGDSHNGGGSYGSFQVHDITNSKPVFVWNNTGHSNYHTAEVAYGLNSTNNPDWTFCSQSQGSCPVPTSFKLRIYINPPITPLADATPPTVSRIDARAFGKNGDTITVRSTEVGTAYLVNQSVTVTNLASITGAAAANRNSVSISAVNTNTTLALSSLNDGLYNLYAVDSANNLSSAVVATIRIDNTLPTASSIAVNSSGTAVILTASETITNSLQATNTYTISDSGSALSVSSTSFSANVATLNLSRPIPAGATVYFSYAPSTGAAGGRWIDQAGNEMAAIPTRTITNNSASAISVILSVPSTLSKGISITISAAVSVAGRVTFTFAGKRIPGCLNKVASGMTPITVTCVFKPALTARQVIRATLVPTIGAYPTTVASEERFILKRTTTR